jgi:branched-chain amino acid transport system ATP-binding protein
MLNVSQLCVHYGGISAVSDLSINVNEHETVALIGANGAGKSTTLKAISGLVPVSSGKCEYEGESITNIEADIIVSRGIVQVPEGRQVFAKMSIRENLRMGAYLQKDRVLIKRNYEKVMTLFPILKDRQNQSAGTLSGGEQQMLAIGRALMANPRLLLLDEPSMGLSPIVTQQVFTVLHELKEEGMTILLVEQNAYAALELSDRTFVLETGSVIMEGKSSDLIDDENIKNAYLGGDL